MFTNISILEEREEKYIHTGNKDSRVTNLFVESAAKWVIGLINATPTQSLAIRANRLVIIAGTALINKVV